MVSEDQELLKGVVKLETLWWILTYGETSVPALALLSTVVWQMSRVNKEQLIANSVTRLLSTTAPEETHGLCACEE